MKKQLKFNDYVKSFPHEIFGKLTIIKSHKEEDTYWFVGNEIKNILGFKKLSNAIRDANLDADEVKYLDKKNNSKIFNDFIYYYKNKGGELNVPPSEDPIISKYSNSITLIKESGLYGLIMASRKPIAIDFQRAIRKDVLPAVRKLFGVNNDLKIEEDIRIHVVKDYQKLNSKISNSISLAMGGVNQVVSDNIYVSLLFTNEMPRHWKKLGQAEAKKRGIPVSKINSSLEAHRLMNPALSCAISQFKKFVNEGMDAKKAFDVTGSDICREYFKMLIDNNVIPHELGSNYNKPKALK